VTPFVGDSVTPVELPPDILARIAADYPPEDRPGIIEALLVLTEVTREPERVARCVLFVADGDLEEFERMIELARTDYRDTVVAAEYDHADRRLRDLSKPFEDGELRP
jgi:hypothetical protein